MTAAEIESVADEFFAAIEAGDVERIRSLYAPDARIWHNYDQVEQSVEENLRTLAFIAARTTNRRYDEIRRSVVEDGFVQQHVLRAEAPGGELEIPAMMRVGVADGRITRVEEYLDPAQAAVLRHAA